MPLSDILIPGESWKRVEIPGTPAALACDPAGNLAIADAKDRVFHLLGEDGKLTKRTTTAVVSALAISPKGTIYLSMPSRNAIRTLFETGEEKTVVENVEVAAMTFAGDDLWYLANSKIFRLGQEVPVESRFADLGGLVAWHNGGTLVTGLNKGRHLLALRLKSDGSVDAPERYAPLRVRQIRPGDAKVRETEASQVTALARDDADRIYAATKEGVQIFDPTGRMCGVLLSPAPAPVSALAIGQSRLYIICDGKLWCRKIKGKKGPKS
jgi:enterochelin esterase family protein